jgi:cyclophilin family peptidyl-prolyl cis-trans isomerase
LSQTAPQRNPAVLAGFVLILTIVLGAAAFGLNSVTNPQPTAGTDANICKPAPNGHPQSKPTRTYSQPQSVNLDPANAYRAVMCTVHGLIVIDLRTDTAPLTAGNFIFLANAGFYDGLTFHRVCPSTADSTCGGATFGIAQGGDPLGTGTGGPGYSLKDEGPKGPYGVGTLAMARSSAVSGSQFFINTTDNTAVLAPQPSVFNIFGDISGGLAVAQKLQKGDKIYWVAIQSSTPTPASPSASPGASPAAAPGASPAASPSATPAPSPS